MIEGRSQNLSWRLQIYHVDGEGKDAGVVYCEMQVIIQTASSFSVLLHFRSCLWRVVLMPSIAGLAPRQRPQAVENEARNMAYLKMRKLLYPGDAYRWASDVFEWRHKLCCREVSHNTYYSGIETGTKGDVCRGSHVSSHFRILPGSCPSPVRVLSE